MTENLVFLPFIGFLGKTVQGITVLAHIPRVTHLVAFLYTVRHHVPCSALGKSRGIKLGGREKGTVRVQEEKKKKGRKENSKTHLTDQRCDQEDERGLPFIPDIPPTR